MTAMGHMTRPIRVLILSRYPSLVPPTSYGGTALESIVCQNSEECRAMLAETWNPDVVLVVGASPCPGFVRDDDPTIPIILFSGMREKDAEVERGRDIFVLCSSDVPSTTVMGRMCHEATARYLAVCGFLEAMGGYLPDVLRLGGKDTPREVVHSHVLAGGHGGRALATLVYQAICSSLTPPAF